MKHLLKLSDLSPEELHHILDVAGGAEGRRHGTAAARQERGADVLQKLYPHPHQL